MTNHKKNKKGIVPEQLELPGLPEKRLPKGRPKTNNFKLETQIKRAQKRQRERDLEAGVGQFATKLPLPLIQTIKESAEKNNISIQKMAEDVFNLFFMTNHNKYNSGEK